MGKTRGWLSSLKRMFTSKANISKEPRKKPRNGGESAPNPSSFSLHREASSVEKILEDAETSARPHWRATSKTRVIRPSPTGDHFRIAAVRIQAAYRGRMARRRYRTLKALIRLQSLLGGQNVKHQTINTMRSMRMLVHVQSQIRARRIQMMHSNASQLMAPPKSDVNLASSLTNWSHRQQPKDGSRRIWDDRVLNEEELEARMHRKIEAVICRERALAYAYTQQLRTEPKWKSHLPWRNWIHHHRPREPPPPRSRPTPFPTPQSDRTPISGHASRPCSRSRPPTGATKHGRSRLDPRLDSESLTSCPPFALTPNYMAPTASAKAKFRSAFGTWRKGPSSLADEERGAGKHRATGSLGSLSLDSTVSVPVGIGRRAFR